jgi:hypothetical protein
MVDRAVAALIKTHNTIVIIKIVERFNGAVQDECDNDSEITFRKLRRSSTKLMQHDNEDRLHAALGYRAPASSLSDWVFAN